MIIDARLLHKRWSGDTSAQLTFLTSECGLINALYKGARSAKKQAILQPFTPLWLALKAGRNGYYVRQLELSAPSLVFSQLSLFAGLYLNELLYHVLQPEDPMPELFCAYQETLSALTTIDERTGLEIVLRRFEWQLLALCGYEVMIDSNIRADATYIFIPDEGFRQAPEGLLHGRDLLAWRAEQFDNPRVLRVAKQVMRSAIGHLLGNKQLKTRQLWAQLSSESHSAGHS